MEQPGPSCGSEAQQIGVQRGDTADSARLSDKARSRGIRVAGMAIMVLSVGAALLPVDKGISSDMIGGLLIAGGLIEAVAGSLRRDSPSLSDGGGRA